MWEALNGVDGLNLRICYLSRLNCDLCLVSLAAGDSLSGSRSFSAIVSKIL